MFCYKVLFCYQSKLSKSLLVSARRGVLRIGVILTDGRAKYVRATEGEARVIKDAGVFLIAVGVGRLIKVSR